MLAEARPTANVVDEMVLGGIPRVESPLFDSTSHEVPLTPEERRIAQSLREDGFAIIDFPDPEFELRSERLKQHLGPMFGINLADRESVRSASGNLRVQDAWRYDEDVKAIAANRRSWHC